MADLDTLKQHAEEAANAADKATQELAHAKDTVTLLELAETAAQPSASLVGADVASPYTEQLAELEKQLAEARRTVVFKEAAAQTLARRDIAATKALNDALEAVTRDRLAREHDATEHWHRRFHTSLAIANGGAFLAIASHVFDKDASQTAVAVSFWVLAPFAFGLVAGGSVPLVLAREVDVGRPKRAEEQMRSKHLHAEKLALLSALLFCLGLGFALGAVWELGHPKTKPKPAPAPQITRVSPPTSTSGPAAKSLLPPPLPGKSEQPPQRSGPQGEASPP